MLVKILLRLYIPTYFMSVVVFEQKFRVGRSVVRIKKREKIGHLVFCVHTIYDM